MKNPLVSIICTTFNHESFIRQALDGFVMQKTNFDFEIIVHDDASTDNTILILNEYEQNYPELFKNIYQTENQFSKLEKNIWFDITFPTAKGKYIALCEGDDYWIDPLKLQKQIDFLENNPEYVGCGNYRNIVDSKGNIILNSAIADNNPHSIHTQCVVFKNVDFDDDFKKVAATVLNGDTFLFLYLEQFGIFKSLDFVGACYRISDSGIFSLKSMNQKYQMCYQSFNVISEYFLKQKQQKLYKKSLFFIAHLHLNYAYKKLSINNFTESFELFLNFNKELFKINYFQNLRLINIKINLVFLATFVKKIIKN